MLELVKTDRVYSSSEISKKLGIASATLRKYNSYFSKVGIHFKKEKGKLVYSEEDLEMFRMLMKVHETSGTNLETAVAEVASVLQHSKPVAEPVASVVEPVVEVTQPVAEPQQPKQESLEEKLLKRMDEQDKKMQEMKEYIDTSLEKRDKQMMDTIRTIQEIKDQQKKGFFYWLRGLFGKNK